MDVPPNPVNTNTQRLQTPVNTNTQRFVVGSTTTQVMAPATITLPPPDPAKPGKLIDPYFRMIMDHKCSDLHLSVGNPPLVRKDGDIMPVKNEAPMTQEKIEAMLREIMPPKNSKEFEESWDTDFAYELDGVGRFRANIFTDRRGWGAVFRQIPNVIPSAVQIGLPEAVLRLCNLPKGLVLVTGPTGSGKSTTLAALIDHINRTRTDHIITIEDPIEFTYTNNRCLVNQREVHRHTKSFSKALRAALREDPDIVLVGEMRDLETTRIAIETAETGHLVFATLHTATASSTVDRMINQFPAEEQEQIRLMLAGSLKAVISQVLIKKRGGGRVAAREIMIVNSAISTLIREGKTHQLETAIQMSKKSGNSLLNEMLQQLAKESKITGEDAYEAALDKEDMHRKLVEVGVKIDVSKVES
jgi:twitching motility protein PilT